MKRTTPRRPDRSPASTGLDPSRRRRFAPRAEALEGRALMAASLLKDINPLDTYPQQITDVGGVAYFVSRDAANGFNLWRSDGTAAGSAVLKNYPVAGMTGYGSIPQNLANIGGSLCLTVADLSGSPATLEKVDPTSGAVTDVAQLTYGSNGYGPFNMTDLNGRAIFETLNVSSTRELIGSDGTAGGTVVLKSNITFGLSDDSTAKAGPWLVFVAPDSHGNAAIWRTDGTVAGTSMASTLPTLASGTRIKSLTSIGGQAVFQIAYSNGTSDLWVTDATPIGTKAIATNLAIPGPMVSAGGKAYFQGYQGDNDGLYATDGTAAGTSLLQTMGISGFPGAAENLAAAGSRLFFVAAGATSGENLWVSDGTPAGTVPVADIRLGPGSPADIPYVKAPVLEGVHSGVFFANYDDAHGLELWHSDGTPDGTGMVADLNPGPDGSDPTALASVGDRLAFAAHDPNGGDEIWFSDGSAVGTAPALALPTPRDQGSFVPLNGSNANPYNPSPSALAIGTATYFVASDPDHGQELWKTDGTTGGTVLVKDINPGPGDSQIVSLTNLNGTLVFFAVDGSGPLQPWRSDGTAAGTYALAPSPLSRATIGAHFVMLNGAAYYFGQGSAGGQALWKTDGTVFGTVAVTNVVNSGGFPVGFDLTRAGSRLYFGATDPQHGRELWSSDGTASGTGLVKDIQNGTNGADPQNLAAVGSTLFFSADDGLHGRELWKSDGTPAGTVLVADIASGTGGSEPTSLVASGSRIFFLADGGAAGAGLWTSSGTGAGTVLLKSYGVSPYLLGQGYLADNGGTLYFAIRDGQDRGLYRTDGTPAGTIKLAAPNGLVVGPIYSLGGKIYFPVANNDTNPDGSPAAGWGDDLYVSDGTPAGTVKLARIGPFTADTPPQPVGVLPGGDVLVFGDDGFHGVEPLIVNAAPPANRSPILYPIPGQTIRLGQAAHVVASGSDPDFGQTVTFSLGANAPAGAAIDPATGAFSWSPSLAQGSGTFTFTVIATDSGSPAATASATLSVVVLPNRAPALDPIADGSISQYATFGFFAHATDPDAGQTVTYSLDAGAPAGAAVDPSTGQFTWMPTSSQGPGDFLITLRATDNGLPALSAARTFTVTVLQGNRPPVLATIPSQTIPQNATLSFTAVATDPDANQSITYTLDAGAPAGASIDSKTGIFQWTPTTAVSTVTYNVTVRATDNGQPPLAVTQVVSIRVTDANAAPSLAAIADRSVSQLATLALTAAATDPDAGQSITYSLAAGAPAGASIDAKTGAFSWTPSASQGPGSFAITVIATDDGLPALSASRAFRVTVTPMNQAPTLNAVADQVVDEGRTLSFAVIGGDPDVGQTLRYSLDPGAPAWATIDPVLGRISLRPTDGPTAADITVRITDDGSPALSATRTFRATVANVAPTVTLAASDMNLKVGSNLARSGSFADPGADTWTATVDYGDGSGKQPLALNADKSFSLSHAYAAASTYRVVVVVTDKDGGVGTAGFSANVAAPVLPTPGLVRFGQATYTVDENAGAVQVEVDFTPGTDPTGSIAIVTTDGSARAGVDYTQTFTGASFAAGETRKVITVPILDAGLFSGQKSFQIAFRDPPGNVRIDAPSVVTVVILDNDPAPAPVTIEPVHVDAKKGKVADFRVTFTGPVAPSDAENLANYQLAAIAKGRKGSKVLKPIRLASAHYDPGTNAVTLLPAGKLAMKGSSQLTITSSAIHDRFGRAINAGAQLLASVRASQVGARAASGHATSSNRTT